MSKMEGNIIMGGRGGNSAFTSSGLKESGLDVTYPDGSVTRFYFNKNGNTNYYQRGIAGIPQPTPLNMSAAEFRQRVLANGATVKDVTVDEYKADIKAQNLYRKDMDKFLDKHWFDVRPRYGWKGH